MKRFVYSSCFTRISLKEFHIQYSRLLILSEPVESHSTHSRRSRDGTRLLWILQNGNLTNYKAKGQRNATRFERNGKIYWFLHGSKRYGYSDGNENVRKKVKFQTAKSFTVLIIAWQAAILTVSKLLSIVFCIESIWLDLILICCWCLNGIFLMVILGIVL